MATKTGPRIVIVGAGLAGLSAAGHLIQNGMNNVIILEASDRVGGRILSAYNIAPKGGVVELGAHAIHGTALTNSTLCAASQLQQLEGWTILDRWRGFFYTEDGRAIDPELSSKVRSLFNDVHLKQCNFYLENKQPPEHLDTSEKYLRGEMEKVVNTLEPHERQNARAVINTLMNFISFYDGDDLSRHSSALRGQYEDIAGQEVVLTGGYSNFVQTLVNQLPATIIAYKSEVVSIVWNSSEDNKTIVTCSSGTVYAGDHVIVTCSLGFLKEKHAALFKPSLPPVKIAAIERTGFGFVNKIILIYDKPFWPGIGAFKLAWSDDRGKPGDMRKWYKKICSFDEPITARGILVSPVGGPEAKHLETLSLEEVAQTCTKILRKFLDNPSIPEPKRVIVTRWVSDPYSRGSYSYSAMGASREDRDYLAQPLLRDSSPVVLFAGEATHSRWFSTTHGARSSGLREAQRLVSFYKPSSHL